MNLADTIVACATGPARGTRSMLRVSGYRCTDKITSIVTGTPLSRGSAFAVLHLTPALSLPILALRYAGAASYTGEDAVELLMPGNPALVDRVITRLCALPGVRRALPGEFSARAHLNGKLTVEQAEGVAAVIAASSSNELESARRLMNGRTGADYRRFVEECATLLALVEAGIDFTDQEDVVAISTIDLDARLTTLRDAIARHLGAASAREVRDSLPRVVLVGAPNAGKSTLFNALLGRRRAVASPTAGTTRDVLAEEVDLSRDVPAGPRVVIEDLPGLDTDVAGLIDLAAQRAARAAIEDADVIVCCDPAGREEGVGTPARSDRSRSVVRVRTFGDRPAPGAASDFIPVCALDGWNLTELRRAIATAANASTGTGTGALVLPRHRDALRTALQRLGAAQQIAQSSRTKRALSQPELIADSLREALDSLGELMGRISPDEVLGRIFASFCIGK